ncbi:MAG: hypothetical protein FWE67_03230 [Planctomycetaceae bacterium]|nr:hypothetical protein [Planctomycetaceae bacterium]
MTAVIPEKPAKSRLDIIEDGDALIINAPPRRSFIGWFLTAGFIFFFALFCTCIYFVIFPDKDMARMKAAGMAAGFLFFSAFEFWCVCNLPSPSGTFCSCQV